MLSCWRPSRCYGLCLLTCLSLGGSSVVLLLHWWPTPTQQAFINGFFYLSLDTGVLLWSWQRTMETKSGLFLPCSWSFAVFLLTVATFIPTLLHPPSWGLFYRITLMCDFEPGGLHPVCVCVCTINWTADLWQPTKIQAVDFPDQTTARKVNHNHGSFSPWQPSWEDFSSVVY